MSDKPWKRGSVSDLIDGLVAGVSVRSTTGSTAGPAILKTSAVDKGRFIPAESKRILDADLPRARCNPAGNSMIISRMNTPALVGDVGYVAEDRPDLFLPDRLWMARAKRGSGASMRWLTYHFASEPGARQLQSLATGTSGSMKNIPKDRILNLEIAIPMADEQHAIASALADIDVLIETLETFIAKKSDVKQGLMQELLTGRTRLPGFTGDWREVELGELGVFLKGRGINRDQVRFSGVPCIRYGELYTAYHDYARETVSFVDPDVATSALPIRSGDLLFAGSGETKAEIGMTVAYIGEPAAVAGGDIIVLRGNRFDPIFLGSLLNTPSLAAQKASRGQGDAVVHIGAGALSALRFRLPAMDEQREIAEVLQGVDAEIEALQRRLGFARAVKVGMMQELLTGRTRLPVREEA